MATAAATPGVCFNADYRLSPKATFPDHLVDVKTAIAWIRDHAEEYGIDPDFLAVTGGSAGGHLTALTALTQNDPRYQPGFESADTSVQAAVPFYGVYDFTNRAGTMPSQFRDWFLQPLIMKAFYDDEPERFREASPLDNLRPDLQRYGWRGCLECQRQRRIMQGRASTGMHVVPVATEPQQGRSTP